MSLGAYWVSNMIFDICRGMIPAAIVIGLLYAFDLNYNCAWLLFLLFPIGVTPFTYVTSFLFTSEIVAQTITIFAHFVIAGIGAIVIFILELIESTRKYADVLKWVLRVMPSYNLTYTIMYDAGRDSLKFVRPEIAKLDDWDLDFNGGNVLVIMLHFGFWIIVLFFIEFGAFNWIGTLTQRLGRNNIAPLGNEVLNLDEDVLEEEERVKKASTGLQIRVNNFRKIYPGMIRKPVLAVERTSFGLDYGECFALLGVNGAGKTTTFKALTNEINPTSGSIQINGLDVARDFGQVRKLIGYCPQYDAIFPLMTVEQHLEYYARIKGIPRTVR